MDKLERVDKRMLESLLAALRRHDPELQRSLASELALPADAAPPTVTGTVSAGLIVHFAAALRSHDCFDSVHFLAGQNAFHLAATDRGYTVGGGGLRRFEVLLAEMLPSFLGRATWQATSHGPLRQCRLAGSLFARIDSLLPTCGFYRGFLAECSRFCVGKAFQVDELRCASEDVDNNLCVFQFAV